MFKKVFVEREVLQEEYVQGILAKLKIEPTLIDDYSAIWGKVKKPYLHKRTNLNLFIAKKRGELLKETPPAYGFDNNPHYYFIHSYNCIYECSYCYLQGYFNTPDIVLFSNHRDIIQEMEKVTRLHQDETQRVWFHAGEFSDSLALSSISQEWPIYWSFFLNNPKAFLELRTKSSNIKEVLKLEPLPNIITSFSLSSEKGSKDFDLKCPKLDLRIQAIGKLVQAGHRIGIHLDPIIYEENFKINYSSMLEKLNQVLPNESLEYMSLGVPRFTKNVYQDMKKNYPKSPIHYQELVTSFDGKIRYSRPMRNWILNFVKEKAAKYYEIDKIYLCMED